MRATVLYGVGDVRIETVPDATLIQPTDALVRVTRACICGSDLWPYASLEPTETGQRMGHEAIGVVEEVGDEVRTLKPGGIVVMPFAFSDGTCVFCHEGLQTGLRARRVLRHRGQRRRRSGRVVEGASGRRHPIRAAGRRG